MQVPFLVLGGGLSGLAAAIRFARFFPEVQILEQHSRPGGLNSYYYRHGQLWETGLHAITNFAPPEEKKAPLNRLFRQLQLDRRQLPLCEQTSSAVFFPDGRQLVFSNRPETLSNSIRQQFPSEFRAFITLLEQLDRFDPFQPVPFRSARAFLNTHFHDRLLIDMLLCPLFFYGSSVANDMDLSQFAIMFRALYREGMFRPAGSIKHFLDLLLDHYRTLGGSIRFQARVAAIEHQAGTVSAVRLESGERISCRFLLSTIGHQETLRLLGKPPAAETRQRLSFVESIFQLPESARQLLPSDRTILFYNNSSVFSYAAPNEIVDLHSGVICFPDNFQNYQPPHPLPQLRTTHLTSYAHWRQLAGDPGRYTSAKQAVARQSLRQVENLLGTRLENIVYEDTFTPLTIERYTAKQHGAIYGSPDKVKTGDIGFDNLFLAGTDQGFLGIVGSMLSGISMVNQHILPRL